MKTVLIKDLPEVIKKRALECQVEQGNEPNENIDLDSGSFCWGDTKEGAWMWYDVDKGYYQPFYDFHNITADGTPKEKIKLSKKEIADKFGINIDSLEIVD
jgi:hypothetical protein